MKVHELDELLILTLMQNLNKRRVKMREFQTYLKRQTYPSISITRSSASKPSNPTTSLAAPQRSSQNNHPPP